MKGILVGYVLTTYVNCRMGVQLPDDELKGIPLGLLRVGLCSQTQVDFGHPDRESKLSELVESVPQEVGGDRCELALDCKGVDWATLQRRGFTSVKEW